MSAGQCGPRFSDFMENRNHAHGFDFTGWSQVKRLVNSRMEGCCMGNDPYPEIEDVHSSGIEACEPTRMAALHF